MTDIVLTLIHGTWAPHAPWTLPDSPLRKALAGQLGDRIAFETLEWSGANTHRARREAAQKLRAQLADSIAANPLARHFLVAHSHGGNVALYAMADATLRQHIAGIACLNSPFICALKRNTKQFMLEIFAWMAAYFVLLFMAYAVFYVLAPLSTDPNLQHLGLLAQIGLGLGFAAVLILLIFFVIEPGLMYSRKLEDRVASWAATRRAGISQDIILPQNPDVPVLCAWTAGDEVISSFGLLDALANMPYLALSFIGLILSFVVIYGLQAFGILPSLFTVPTIDPTLTHFVRVLVRFLLDYPISTGMYMVALLVGLFSAAVFVNLLFRVLPMGIGFDKLVDSLFVRLAFTVTPVTSNHIEFLDIESEHGFLGHSKAYSDADLLAELAGWISARLARPE